MYNFLSNESIYAPGRDLDHWWLSIYEIIFLDDPPLALLRRSLRGALLKSHISRFAIKWIIDADLGHFGSVT